MAHIVFGVGTSHSSQLSIEPAEWAEQAELDRTRTPWEDLIAHARPDINDQLSRDVQDARHERAQQALWTLADTIRGYAPDVLLVVGDDQGELFPHEAVPAIALSLTDGMDDIPPDLGTLDAIRRKAVWAFHAESREFYPFDAGLSEHVAASLNAAGFDLTVLRAQPEGRTLGHAWTFVRRRLLGDAPIPMVPVFLNTYFGPNRPTPSRCVALGAALAEAVRTFPGDLRVGFVASGGLSHFVVDEALDLRIIDALKGADVEQLAAEAPEQFTSGTSEILNWITVGSALRDLQFGLLDYIPAYRSIAGTGCGFAFGVWEGDEDARSR
jgi:3-O-methylgallate 3,4-dioxygenase